MESTPRPDSATAQLMEQILYEVKRVVVGQDRFLERVMVAMLAQGHLLVEGVPGLAKTLTVKTLANTMRGQFKRIQFTPDLVPADLVGTRIYNQKTGDFSTSLGPVFANLLLADEINRAPAKVQSALLEVMQERQVTIAGETHKVPNPFLVMATQNPIETEGTYPLPEAQVDRFMMKVLVDYPTDEEEFVIVSRVTGPAVDVTAVATTEQLAALQAECRRVYVDPSLVPARHHQPDRGCPGPGHAAGPQLRLARGHDRPGARRAAPPRGAVVRGAVRGPHAGLAHQQDHGEDPCAGQAAGTREAGPGAAKDLRLSHVLSQVHPCRHSARPGGATCGR